jgi:hypothetical protein
VNVDVKRGPIIHHYGGKALYVEWPDGRLTVDGRRSRRITKDEAARLLREANQDSEQEG